MYLCNIIRCQNVPGSYQCYCPDGLVGDPVKGGCRKPGDCFTDSDCPSTAACINHRCTNPCEVTNACGKNAHCTPLAHAPTCRCPPQTRGDPKVKFFFFFSRTLQIFFEKFNVLFNFFYGFVFTERMC